MIKIDNALAGKAERSGSVEAILLASAWVGDSAPFSQDLTIEELSSEQNGIAMLAKSATDEQKAAAEKAALNVGGQSDGVLTILCEGEKPYADIPITVILIG